MQDNIMGSSEIASRSLLFTPFQIRGVTFKNRIVVSPMCQYSSEDGFVNDWHFVHLGSFATGGAGMVMVEATGVEARGRLTPGCTGIWKDEHIEPLARIAKFLKSQGSVPAIQLAHAGRKASTVPLWVGRHSIADEEGGWPTIGASAVAFGDEIWKVPKEATIEDLNDIKKAHIFAAKRAVKAGFEVIELSYSHGYLVNTFLCPLTNLRTDKYGGSLENRMRLGLEIAKSVREAIPEDIVLGVRLSVTDYADNGWDVSHSKAFAKELKTIGIDYIDCSSGFVVSNVEYHGLNYNSVQISASAEIQKEVGIPTAAVGKIVDPNYAEKILKDGGATFIVIGRAFINNPHWPYHAMDVLGAENDFKFPNQYTWAIGSLSLGNWRQNVLNTENNNY